MDWDGFNKLAFIGYSFFLLVLLLVFVHFLQLCRRLSQPEAPAEKRPGRKLYLVWLAVTVVACTKALLAISGVVALLLAALSGLCFLVTYRISNKEADMVRESTRGQRIYYRVITALLGCFFLFELLWRYLPFAKRLWENTD